MVTGPMAGAAPLTPPVEGTLPPVPPERRYCSEPKPSARCGQSRRRAETKYIRSIVSIFTASSEQQCALRFEREERHGVRSNA